jgi:xanthine/uracil permease
MVSGVTIFLIGAALIGSGFQDWGGGAYCAEYVNGLPAEALG